MVRGGLRLFCVVVLATRLAACGGGAPASQQQAPATPPPAVDQTTPYQAGFQATTVADPYVPGTMAPLNIWYPTHEAAMATSVFPWTLQVAKDAVPADGLFRLVVVSHGNGGNEFVHRDLGEALARQGFIVAAPRHTGNNAFDNSQFMSDVYWFGRPRLMSATIDRVWSDLRLGGRVDTAGVGVVGHSAGGYTALTLAGAVPQLSLIASHCAAHADDKFCDLPLDATATAALNAAAAMPVPLLADPRIHAMVLMAPVGAMFDDAALSRVAVPSRIYGAQFDDLAPAPYHAAAIAAALGTWAELSVVPNANHYAFLAPFPALLSGQVDGADVDRPGFDRAAFHAQLNAEIFHFFDTRLH